MLKILGALLLCLSGSAYGFCLAGELKDKVRLLEELNRCLLVVRGEIRFANASLPEAFGTIKHRVGAPFGELFGKVGDTLLETPDMLLSDVWEKQVRQQFEKSVFSKEELDWLCAICGQLGYLDREMQLNTIQMIMEQLALREKEARAKLADNAKVYRCIGTMCGILVALLLI